MTLRLAIITNDAAWAALHALACHPGNLPASVAVIDQPDRMLAVPDGVAFICFWRGDRYETVELQDVWERRRARGGVEPASDEDWARIEAFAARRTARDRSVLYGEAEAVITSPLAGEDSKPAGAECDSMGALGEGCEAGPHPSPTSARHSAAPHAAFVSSPTRGEVEAPQASRWH